MKSYVGYVLLYAILMLVISPVVLANTWTVDDGSGSESYYFGNASAWGWGASSFACANADGDCQDCSCGMAWGSRTVYTDQAGYFTCSYNCSADATASYSDFDGSGASGSGGSSASTPGGGADAGITKSSEGPWTGDAGEDYDPGCAGQVYLYLRAFDSVSASCNAGAGAQVGDSNMASGSSYSNADVSL